MKRKTCICTITFVIAGLLISSVSGTFAQMNVEKEQLENKNIGEALSEEIMILSCDELEEISIGQQTASKNVFDRMSLSTPSQSMDAQTGSLLLKTEGQRDVTILALHPALANDGMGHLVLGYYYYYYELD